MSKHDFKLFIYSSIAGSGFTGMFFFALGIPDQPMICIPLFILSIILLFVFSLAYHHANKLNRCYHKRPTRLYQGKCL